jgi:hypothetical protein
MMKVGTGPGAGVLQLNPKDTQRESETMAANFMVQFSIRKPKLNN